MFLCYGQEEFLECRDDQHFPANPLNFTDMLEQRNRRESKMTFKREEALSIQKQRTGEVFSTKAATSLKTADPSRQDGAEADDRFREVAEDVEHLAENDSIYDVGETRVGESHLDDLAAAYEESCKPDALLKLRESRRAARAAKPRASVASQNQK